MYQAHLLVIAAATLTVAPAPFTAPLGTPGCVAPVITQEVAPVTPCVRDHVTPTVAATGTNLHYDWFHGQLPTSFHGSTVDFPHVTLLERGLWCVNVYNECGLATSCARISVNECGVTHCTL